MKRRKIIVFGYWENNLGDDLFLKVFSESHTDSDIYIVVKKKNKHIYMHNNIRVLVSDSMTYRIRKKIMNIVNKTRNNPFAMIKNASSCVFLGGSLFMENDDWHNQIKLINQLVNFVPKCYVIGSNFGPYQTEDFRDSYEQVFKRITSINFRETKSCLYFPDLPNVRFTPDPVFNLDIKPYRKELINNEYIVISNINVENRVKLKEYREGYELKLAQLADLIILQGQSVVFMSFCSFEDDDRAISRIISLMKQRDFTKIKIHTHCYLDESLTLIVNSSGIIAGRFHALILSFLINIPVYPIIYSIKMLNILEDYQYFGKYSLIEEVCKIDISEILVSLTQLPNIPKCVIEQSKEAIISDN